MVMPERRVLIAGGGIGGLSASIALARHGIATAVLERSSFAEETGAGIQLGPNATRLLRALGALEAIEQAAFKPEAIWVFDGLSGRRLTTVPLGREAEHRYGAPYLTLHRADLHAGLLAVARQLAPVELRPGVEISRIEADRDGVAAESVNGIKTKGSSLVGADGVWSVVRGWIAPGARLRFTGGTACRALLPVDGLPGPFGEPMVGLWLGPGAHLVHYPVRGGRALNVVAVIESGSETQGWDQAADPDTLHSGFTRWCKESKSLLEQAEGWRRWSLYRLRKLPRWSRGPATLLGDAAHPVLPFLAQGAALAIEDAAALAASLAADRVNAVEAFLRYETLRHRRTMRVQRLSRRFGRLYHLRGSARFARNLVLARRGAATSLDQFDWLYGEERLN